MLTQSLPCFFMRAFAASAALLSSAAWDDFAGKSPMPASAASAPMDCTADARCSISDLFVKAFRVHVVGMSDGAGSQGQDRAKTATKHALELAPDHSWGIRVSLGKAGAPR